jgi:hypothetical protein
MTNKTPTTKDVHTEHCCIVHGCKYGDDDCSVATGKLNQSFRCESCDPHLPKPTRDLPREDLLPCPYCESPECLRKASAIREREKQYFSVSLLQRRLCLGYIHACVVYDALLSSATQAPAATEESSPTGAVECKHRWRRIIPIKQKQCKICKAFKYPWPTASTEEKEIDVEKFLREYDEGKHPLSPEFLSALEKSKPQLFKDIRRILSGVSTDAREGGD